MRGERGLIWTRKLERIERLDTAEPGIQVVAWTPAEWRRREARGDPIAREAQAVGVWLFGSAEAASAD